MTRFSWNPSAILVGVDRAGMCSVVRDQDTLHSDFHLPVNRVFPNAIASTYIQGEPCFAVGGATGKGMHMMNAVTLDVVMSLPYDGEVLSVCIDDTAAIAYFGTLSGLPVTALSTLLFLSHCFHPSSDESILRWVLSVYYRLRCTMGIPP